MRLNFTAAYSGTLHLYAVDWDATVAPRTSPSTTGRGPRTVSLTSAFNPGAWVHFPITVAAGGSVLITVDNDRRRLQRRPVGPVPRRGRDATATATASTADDRQPGRPGRLGRHLRRRRLRPRRLERDERRPGQPAGRRELHPRAGHRATAGRLDRRPTCAPSRARTRPSAGRRTWYDADRGPGAPQLHRGLQRHPPPVRRRLGRHRSRRERHRRRRDAARGRSTSPPPSTPAPGSTSRSPSRPAARSSSPSTTTAGSQRASSSALFLGGAGRHRHRLPPPPPPTIDSPGVQGDWVGNYGADGYVLGAWNGRAATWPACRPA